MNYIILYVGWELLLRSRLGWLHQAQRSATVRIVMSSWLAFDRRSPSFRTSCRPRNPSMLSFRHVVGSAGRRVAGVSPTGTGLLRRTARLAPQTATPGPQRTRHAGAHTTTHTSPAYSTAASSFSSFSASASAASSFAASFHSFSRRVSSRCLSFLRSPLVKNGVLLLSMGGLVYVCVEQATSPEQRKFLESGDPEMRREREQWEWQQMRAKMVFNSSEEAAKFQLPSSAASLYLNANVIRRESQPVPTVLLGLIGLNVAVCGLHFLGRSNHQVYAFMAKHFFTSWLHMEGRLYHTLLTSVFSHVTFWHLAANMFTLFSLAPAVIHLIGEKQFLGAYLTCGVLSSLAENVSCKLYPYATWRRIAASTPCLGASGAVFSVVGMILAFFPANQYGMLLIPVYFRMDQLVWALGTFDIGGYVYKLVKGPTAGLNIGHMAHFSGMVAGYAYANTILKWQVPAARARLQYNQRMAKLGL
jgi:membrane associated rhomboid family serine protease